MYVYCVRGLFIKLRQTAQRYLMLCCEQIILLSATSENWLPFRHSFYHPNIIRLAGPFKICSNSGKIHMLAVPPTVDFTISFANQHATRLCTAGGMLLSNNQTHLQVCTNELKSLIQATFRVDVWTEAGTSVNTKVGVICSKPDYRKWQIPSLARLILLHCTTAIRPSFE